MFQTNSHSGSVLQKPQAKSDVSQGSLASRGVFETNLFGQSKPVSNLFSNQQMSSGLFRNQNRDINVLGETGVDQVDKVDQQPSAIPGQEKSRVKTAVKPRGLFDESQSKSSLFQGLQSKPNMFDDAKLKKGVFDKLESKGTIES